MYGIIYLTKNLITDARYIGQHKCLTLEDDYLGSGKILKSAIEKYGSENFERSVLWICENKDEMNLMEQYFIWFCGAVSSPYFYNILSGGQGSEGYPTYKRRVCHFVNGEVIKYETMKEAALKTGIGYGTIAARCRGKRQQLSENDYWYYDGEDAIFKKDSHENARKKVQCVETGLIYDSLQIAEKLTGVCADKISRAARGIRKTAGNLHWRLIKD